MPRYFGSAAVAPSPPSTITITSAHNGGWTQIQQAKALYDGDANTTYVGYIDGANGNLEIVTVPDGGSPATPIVIQAAFQVDTHAAPGMIVDHVTGKLVVCASGHNGGGFYTWRSVTAVATDPDLSDGFESAVFTGVSAITYLILVQRQAETDEPIYAWYRTGTGVNTKLAYRKTTDAGDTWSAQTVVYQYPNAYWKIATDSQWRIDFFVTSGAPPGDSSIYHFYADDEDYKQSDGTPIGGAFPMGPGQLTQVYDMTTDGPGWPTDAIYDDPDTPIMVYSVNDETNTNSYFGYARWDGAAWDLSTIIASVGFGIVDPSPVASLDQVVLTDCYLVRKIAGVFELWKYETADSGATWAGEAVTVDSTVDNLYPTSVANHVAGELGVVWLYGTYTSSTDNSLGIMGADV